jgi:hypothetical protein
MAPFFGGRQKSPVLHARYVGGPLATGSDSVGSVRIPAAFYGVVNRRGLFPLWQGSAAAMEELRFQGGIDNEAYISK